MIVRELKVEIRQADVLHQIDCYKDSELYEEVLEEYKEIEEEMYSLCDPVFLMEYGVADSELVREDVPIGTPVLMVLYSIGKGISEYSTKAFSRGDYLKGMLADAMADSALFSLEKEFVPYLKEICAELKMRISRRLEAPQDIPMELQKVIFEKTGAGEKCEMGITSGFMLDPVKSNAILYILTEDKEVFEHQHDCRNCNQLDCKECSVSDVPVKIFTDDKVYTLMVKEKESILDALIAQELSFAAVCGGTGKCGKCKIKLLDGYLPITSSDREHFTEEELEAGMRLACKAYVSQPVQAVLNFRGEENFQVLTDYGQDGVQIQPEDGFSKTDGDCGIAIDIGTTTIALQLLSLKSGKTLASYTTVNHQRSYGADVISRIQASVDGKKEELQSLVRADMSKGIRQVVKQADVLPKQVKEITVAGNTTMIHLLMGYDCKGLGEYPFTPENINPITDDYNRIFKDDFLSAKVRILPGISAFVGGDIVAGLCSCDVDTYQEYSLLVDLGTNGEIAVGNKDRIMVTSTAAGPAFEGGNITYGVGSIEGAIAGVKIEDHKVYVNTIGGKEPVGICGTGVIEAVAELVKEDLLEDSGCLCEEYFDEGYPLAKTKSGNEIFLTQQDIREIQLAKSAIRAGIETLLLRYGITKDDVVNVYLAGGFGYKLDCQKAIEIGMIPGEFEGKVKPVGNASLGGAVNALLLEESWERICHIGQASEEINLSADKDFNQFYMDYMFFEKD